MNGSGLARFGIGVVVAMCALPAAAWADTAVLHPMRAMAFTPVLDPTGTMTFTWHGSASRGCQAAGVCGVSGSLDVIPEDQTGATNRVTPAVTKAAAAEIQTGVVTPMAYPLADGVPLLWLARAKRMPIATRPKNSAGQSLLAQPPPGFRTT